MQVKIKLINNGCIPKKQTEGSAGYDLYANTDATLMPGEFKLIPLGICIELPKGFEAQIRPRSGMALKYGITVLNTPGTIDSDYNLEISVLLINLGKEIYHVKKYDRIAQMVISKYENIDFKLSEEIESHTRFGGWGSSGENDLAI